MLRRISIFTVCGLAMLISAISPVMALDEDADSLGFIDPETTMVMAIDIDEMMDYAYGVGDIWRDSERANFIENLHFISEDLTRTESKPDVLTFFGYLAGVQAFSIDPSNQTGLMVFSADNELDTRVLGWYTVAYIQEMRLDKALGVINSALREYYYEAIEDPETGESSSRMTYPETIDMLLEEGYLDAMPDNPYTGEPVRIVDSPDDGDPGDIYYKPGIGYGYPCGSEAAVEEEERDYRSYSLTSFRIGGTLTSTGWEKEYEPYGDLSTQLMAFSRMYDPAEMGFETVTDGEWTFLTPNGSDYAFGFGDRFLLFSKNADEIMDAVNRYESGDGFRFTPPADFQTEGAFYRDQADIGIYMEEFGDMESEDLPPEVVGMIYGMYESMGMGALESQHTASWLRVGDIESVRRVVLSGEAMNTMIGTLAYMEPEQLMTASGGPIDLIAEVALSNTNEKVHAYLDFMFESFLPMVVSQMGVEDMDIESMLPMMGLGDIGTMDFGDHLNVMITASREREDGSYWPGMLAVLETENVDLAYIASGFVDSVSFMVPDFPLVQMDFGDEDAMTWMVEIDDAPPLTPTIAWTDGWILKGLWREDVLDARDALRQGILLMPDGMSPASMRANCNRRELFRGIADVMYELPWDEVSIVGFAFEILSDLTGPDERLYIEAKPGEGYVEMRCMFSTGLMEELVPGAAAMIQTMAMR